MASHLEDLLYQWYEWRGYIVRRNVKVGRLSHGGWEGELDIVAYHPDTKELIHVEPSVDAHSWAKREERFQKKFASGRKYIYKEVFPWLGKSIPLKQYAVLTGRGRADEHKSIAGQEIVTIDEIAKQIREDVSAQGRMNKAAIPEQYYLLRTIQLVLCGYVRAL